MQREKTFAFVVGQASSLPKGPPVPETNAGKMPVQTGWKPAPLILSGGLALVALLLLAGCASVPPNEQRLVSKPNMVFSDNSIFNYQSSLFPQTEPGAAATGGAAAGGCSSCR